MPDMKLTVSHPQLMLQVCIVHCLCFEYFSAGVHMSQCMCKLVINIHIRTSAIHTYVGVYVHICVYVSLCASPSTPPSWP